MCNQNHLRYKLILSISLSTSSLSESAKFEQRTDTNFRDAEQGNVDAQLNLGVDYYLGSGVVQDYIRAYMWLNIVALQGDLEAAKNLNVIGKDMTPTQIGKAKLLARECVAKNYKGC